MKRILIIDDEPDAIAVLEWILERLHYEVFSISDPFETEKAIKESSPDLIILDWLMPIREGIVVLKEIKAIPEFMEIPVIISTGVRTQSEDLKIALESGAIDFIKKPIDEIELEARVASAIKIRDYINQSRRMQDEIHIKELEIADAKTKLLQNELTKKEREMVVVAVSLFQNKELLCKLKMDIFEEKDRFNDQDQQYLIQVLDKYDNIARSFNWQLFEKRFTELNTDFFTKLTTEFPSLTAGDLRLCALFKVGMSIKEVAILSYSNYEAIRKAVYRIRKKLGLHEKVELNLFLQGY